MFNLPKVTRELHLSDYAPEYGEAVIDIWVTPPRKMLYEFYDIRQSVGLLVTDSESLSDEQRGEQYNVLNERTFAWLSEIWSQGADVSRHFTVEQAKQLCEHLSDTDPKCWIWIVQETVGLIESYREGTRKN